MERRDFLKASAIGASAAAFPNLLKAAENSENRHNIILIYTDQQHANMMSCAGNPNLKTPALDYLAENGTRFTRAYTINPVCVPAQISMMTGRFASEFRTDSGCALRNNQDGMKRFGGAPDEVKQTLLPTFLKDAGYALLRGQGPYTGR